MVYFLLFIGIELYFVVICVLCWIGEDSSCGSFREFLCEKLYIRKNCIMEIFKCLENKYFGCL